MTLVSLKGPSDGCRVIALMPVFNESDIIEHSIIHLNDSGASVYVLDNWSTDGTWEKLQTLGGGRLAGLERNPLGGPGRHYELAATAKRISSLACELGADWYIWHDADEYMQSPWPGIDLRAALFEVGRQGFNAVNFKVVTFPPIDDSFQPGMDFVRHFRHWIIEPAPPDFVWIRAWRNTGVPVGFPSASHEAFFAGRNVFPDKFVLRHYPFRSQAQAIRKVFRDRRPRYSPSAKARGWHNHYDHLEADAVFLRRPEELHKLDEAEFLNEVRER